MEKRLKKKCTVPVHLFWGSTLYHIDHGTRGASLNTTFVVATLLTSSSTVLKVFGSVKRVPDVYTQFRKRMEEVLYCSSCSSMRISQLNMFVHRRKESFVHCSPRPLHSSLCQARSLTKGTCLRQVSC